MHRSAVVALLLAAGCAGGPSPSPSRDGAERLSGHFGENAFSPAKVTGPRLNMERRADGTWGGMFPCKPWLSHASNQLCAADFDMTAEWIRWGGRNAFAYERTPGQSVLLVRPPLEYEFAVSDGRPFPSELVMPVFLAVTTARELGGNVAQESVNARYADTQARYAWTVEVEGLGTVAVRRGPSP